MQAGGEWQVVSSNSKSPTCLGGAPWTPPPAGRRQLDPTASWGCRSGESRAPWGNLQGRLLSTEDTPPVQRLESKARGSGRRALHTDLATGFLRLPRMHALRAPRDAPPRSGARRLWRELECARGGRGNSKVGGRKNITALTPRGSSGSLGSRGQSQGAGAAARVHLPARRPFPTWPQRPAAGRRREVCEHAAAASPHPLRA